eukprot:scaffold243085_cov36-Tisochrysis_lutea.AAC.5
MACASTSVEWGNVTRLERISRWLQEIAQGTPATLSKARRNIGMEQMMVETNALVTMAMAAKGKAARSTAVAAVPIPWPAEPIARPRATGSFTPSASRTARPKLATMSPVSTTTVHAMPGSAPTRPEMAMASGAVTWRGRHARVRASLNPSTRARNAEPKRPPNEAAVIAPPTAGSDAIKSVRFSYMLKPNESVAGPSIASNALPGAATAEANAKLAKWVKAVQVISGWTTFWTAFGTRVAPATKPVPVAPSKKASRNGAARGLAERKAAVEIIAHADVEVASRRSSESGNALGAGPAGGAGADGAGIGAEADDNPEAPRAANAQRGKDTTAPPRSRIASRAASDAPSFRTRATVGTDVLSKQRAANKIIDPARDEGKLIARATKKRLRMVSTTMMALSERAPFADGEKVSFVAPEPPGVPAWAADATGTRALNILPAYFSRMPTVATPEAMEARVAPPGNDSSLDWMVSLTRWRAWVGESRGAEAVCTGARP